MGIHVADRKSHWNYFLALERDLETVSRYIEFCEPNFSVFSIELAHLLLAASSEVDVVAKRLCELVAPDAPRRNINDYKSALLLAIPDLPMTEILVARYGLTLNPWSNWDGEENPHWWRSYNNVKHERDAYFHEATLKNALNALGALLILTYHYYARALAVPPSPMLAPKATMKQLDPQSSLLRMAAVHYYDNIVV